MQIKSFISRQEKEKEKKKTHSELLLMVHLLFHVIGMWINLDISIAQTRVT